MLMFRSRPLAPPRRSRPASSSLLGAVGLPLYLGLFATLALPGGAAADEVDDRRLAAATKLDTALADAKLAAEPARQAALLHAAADETLQKFPNNVLLRDTFAKLGAATVADPRAAAEAWRGAVVEARDVLRFQPLIEAPLPVGFPAPTPVGEIEVKQLPKYRLAETPLPLLEGRAFWTLFNHIKSRDIAMTAPVQMGYTAAADGKLKKASMSFLYRSTEQGELGADGGVTVVETPAQLVVGIGLRGDASQRRIDEARARLEAWLEAHADQYRAAGTLRVMAYNSPFVAESKRFTEVQIPVIPAGAAK